MIKANRKQFKVISLLLFIAIAFSTITNCQIKVACIGNSITYGYGLSSPSTMSYPAQLQIMLGSEWNVSNFGLSGRSMLKKGDRPYWNESQYAQALALLPNVVIIKLGTNDSKLTVNWIPYKAEFIDDYKAMIKSFRDLSSKPALWICQTIPACKPKWEITDSILRTEVNPKILSIALDEGINLIDLYTSMNDKNNLYLTDGIHPNAAGAVEIATKVAELLKMLTPQIAKSDKNIKAPTAFDYQWYRNGSRMMETEGGKDSLLYKPLPGYYKVSLKINKDINTRLVSDSIQIVE